MSEKKKENNFCQQLIDAGIEQTRLMIMLSGKIAQDTFSNEEIKNHVVLPILELALADQTFKEIMHTLVRNEIVKNIKNSFVTIDQARTEDLAAWEKFQAQVQREELERLNKLINTPELIDFAHAINMEAIHQREKWGSDHDAGKTAYDWFWLIGYLAGKALQADKAGNTEKLLHHIITTAAALANWHAQILGKCDMRPGILPPENIS